MEHRFGRTLRVFLVLLAAAGLYRLAVVPWVEPRLRDEFAASDLTPEQAAAIRARADRRLAGLGDVFPPGSWERDDPIMLESRQMRLLFRDYHTLPDGRVSLVPCTLVVLPERGRSGGGPSTPGRTLVLRAPQGAVLEFDEPLDLRQGRLAKLVGGSLRGQVSIRGTPSAPGAEDDIEIVTRDVQLAELDVRSGEMVQFRHGRSSGSGRGFAARLAPRQAEAGRVPGIGSVETIRIDRDVRMRLEGFNGGLIPGATPTPAAQPAPRAAAPVLVSCRGSLCLNVAANVITLEDGVEVVRAVGTGLADQLSCDLLAIVLARREQPAAGVPQEGGGAGQPSRGGLEPVEIQAKGAPVVARSAAAGLEARAARLGYEIATRRILLDGDDPVSLVARGTEMEARKIDYCPGPPGEPGALLAVGPGWMRHRAERRPATEARFQHWLRMRPDGKGHVVSLSGDAQVAFEGQGRLGAAEMHLWLDVAAEAPAGAPAGAVAGAAAGAAPEVASPGPDLSRVRPSRLLARGMVEADGEAFAARTDRLELWFRTVPPPVAGPAGAPGPATAVGAASPEARDDRGGLRGRMVASAALVRGLVQMSPAGADFEEVSMEGQVKLVEQPAAGPQAARPAEPGLSIDGDQLQLTRPQHPDARAVVSGRPALVRGRGLDLEGPLVEFDRGRRRMAVDGAGRLSLPLAGGAGLGAFTLTGAAEAPADAAAAPPSRLDTTFQGRLEFDGRTARFIDRVVAKGAATTVRCGALDVTIDPAFDFAGGRAGPQPEVTRIGCSGGVRIDNESAGRDAARSVEQLFLRDLVIDRLTGDVAGTGPGRLAVTRLGQPAAPTPPGGAVQPVSNPPRGPELSYLGVDFQRGLRGNLNRRVVEFQQRVEAIHGPVARWGDTLEPHAAAEPPPGVVLISSELLSVAQAAPLPGQPRSSIELAAGGNVLVEGAAFTARSARLTWSEAKDLLVFEGDGRADAQLFRQERPGAQPSSASAGKILYWRSFNRVDIEDARYLDLDQLRGGSAPSLPDTKPARPNKPRQDRPRSLPST